jgi:hypothetical protein
MALADSVIATSLGRARPHRVMPQHRKRPRAYATHAKTGALRILAVSGQARSPSLPDVPTFEQQGFKGMVLDTWYGAFVPRGTPPAIIRASTPRSTRRSRIPAPAPR